MGDFNKLSPAEEQAGWAPGAQPLRLCGKNRAGQVAAASAEPECPARQTMAHIIYFNQIWWLIKLNSLLTIQIFLSLF